MSNPRIATFFITSSTLLWACSLATTVTYDSNAIVINGERKIIMSGAIHYPRSTSQMWPYLIQNAQDGGLDAIETYIFWDIHEPVRRQYDFSGDLDFIKFLKNVQEAGLYVVLRIGPYVCAEWNYGGFPMWLHNLPGIQLRTDNAVFKEEMQIFTTKIVNMCKEAGLFAPQGGPIIFAQIENEYGDVIEKYGEAGNSYIKWCAQMAVSQNIGVPWIMCKHVNAPSPMINTCNGYYCDDFEPNNPKFPKMFTENWVGWFQKWGERKPHRTAEDVAFSVARFFQRGGVFQNYYMYHGGTNFGRTAGGPYIITAYDYDAPLDEYGNLNQPKWGHLKDLHEALKKGEKILTNGSVSEKKYGNSIYLTTYANNATRERFCFLSNSDDSKDAQVDLQNDGKYNVPAWSVSILQDCNKEVFNTAKVNAQTNIYVKKQAKNGNLLNWNWIEESMDDTLKGQGTFKAPKLLEQKGVTLDSSDYLWYMTEVIINETSSWENATLQVNTTGHVLHAYVNGQYIGGQWGTYDNLNFTYQKPIALRQGTNVISLLSGTVGFANYGAFFDMKDEGIVGGPVKLIGSNLNNTLDLSTYSWSYKVGLNGETRRFFDPKLINGVQWKKNNVPNGRPMTWYMTNFETPEGTDSMVLDLKGLGKGQGWVNGKSIGRYWPTMVAEKTGCSDTCDYKGNYGPEQCESGCGEPSQRFYHVPRSFLNQKSNTLILFEEMGGNPFNVSIQTIALGPICGTTNLERTLELNCQGGKTISEIQFASYGDPQGNCGSFKKGGWESSDSMTVVEGACIGKQSCSINVTSSTFKITKGETNGRLAVQLLCDGSNPNDARVQKVKA
ncbi:beta-galactosidase 15-like [Lotus japonicus]|uniref:beta-galactosidase 15-like n=1 Tax=Lotus japonicus TaxID=34305 RepID=UPI002589B3F3|nr:beta-galactosidase 15-like [Lotus japonicus]